MKVSFLIATHNAQDTLPSLVSKLLDQAGTVYPVELVISEDDGFNYKEILPKDNRIIYAEKGLNSGPSVARNRALKKSTGTHISMMDSDDDISENYLKNIFKGLKENNAVALRTVYIKDGKEIRTFESKQLNYKNFSSFYGSVLTVAPKEWTVKYLEVVAEDGLATLNVLSKKNGELKVVDADYIVNLHDASYCSVRGAEFTEMYKQCASNSFKLAKEIENPELALRIKEFYEGRLEMSRLFDKEINDNPNADYHNFVLQKKLKEDNSRKVRLRPY